MGIRATLLLPTILSLIAIATARPAHLLESRKMLSTPLEFVNDLVIPHAATIDDGSVPSRVQQTASSLESNEVKKSRYSFLVSDIPGVTKLPSMPDFDPAHVLEPVANSEAERQPVATAGTTWASYDLLPEKMQHLDVLE